MPKCSICGNDVDKMPLWLDDVDVKFRCGKCPDTSASALLTVTPEQDEEEIEATHLGPEDTVSLEEEIEAELEEEAEEI